MTSRKRAIFLINSLAGGGAERIMCTLLHHSASERGEFDISLVVLDKEDVANTPPDWVDVRQFDCRGSLPRAVSAVRRLFAELKPDVTLSFLTRSNLSNVLNAGAAACVISERAYPSHHFDRGFSGVIMRSVIRAVYPRARKVIAVSDGVADDLRRNFGVPPHKLVSLANPVDAAGIAQKAAQGPAPAFGAPYIAAAGRLVKVKDFDLLIRAYAASKIPQLLVIAGDGEERAALEETARACGVADRVIFPGFLDNPYPLMCGADLFVLSSVSEGFPNAMVEAMALGVPVIATNCPSGPSQILADAARDAISGLTFAPHGVLTPIRALEPMTEALRAMSDEVLRQDYGRKARERARTYSAEAAKDRYWEVLRSAMAERVHSR